MGNVFSNSSSQFYTKIGLVSSPFSTIHFGASNAYLKISNSHHNPKLAGKIVSFNNDTTHSDDEIESQLYLADRDSINSDEHEVIQIAGLTGFFFITNDYKVYCNGSNGLSELGLDTSNLHGMISSPLRHYAMEHIIRRTISTSNRKIVPKIVCGYSHTMLYFSSEESRDYCLFMVNLEKHARTSTLISDLVFKFPNQ